VNLEPIETEFGTIEVLNAEQIKAWRQRAMPKARGDRYEWFAARDPNAEQVIDGTARPIYGADTTPARANARTHRDVKPRDGREVAEAMLQRMLGWYLSGGTDVIKAKVRWLQRSNPQFAHIDVDDLITDLEPILRQMAEESAAEARRRFQQPYQPDILHVVRHGNSLRSS
jgi:hypothetical protein